MEFSQGGYSAIAAESAKPAIDNTGTQGRDSVLQVNCTCHTEAQLGQEMFAELVAGDSISIESRSAE
jgi:hypothetical protein